MTAFNLPIQILLDEIIHYIGLHIHEYPYSTQGSIFPDFWKYLHSQKDYEISQLLLFPVHL